MTERYSIQVLKECIELQNRKGSDYQNAVSTVKQADYYRLGLNTIYDIMHAKMLRMKSLLETAEANPDAPVNFESITDSAKDLINYASFFASYAEGKMEGQDFVNRDIFNRERPLVRPILPNEPPPILAKPSIQRDTYVPSKQAMGMPTVAPKPPTAPTYKEVSGWLKSDELFETGEVKADPIGSLKIVQSEVPQNIAFDEEPFYRSSWAGHDDGQGRW